MTETSPEAAREGVTVAAEAYLDLREQLVIAPTRDYLGAVIGGDGRDPAAAAWASSPT